MRLIDENKSPEQKFAEYRDFARKHRVVFSLFVLAFLASVGWNVYCTIRNWHTTELEQKVADLKEENGKKDSEIQRLETLLTPFRTIALERYTGPEEEALRKLAQRITGLEKELAQTKEMAKPITLSLLSKNIRKNETGYAIELVFEPSKNLALGLLDFSAVLPKETNVRILDFWPASRGAFTTWPSSRQISDDGGRARLRYSLIGFAYPAVEIKVSGPTPLQFEGNHGLRPFVLDIK